MFPKYRQFLESFENKGPTVYLNLYIHFTFTLFSDSPLVSNAGVVLTTLATVVVMSGISMALISLDIKDETQLIMVHDYKIYGTRRI